MGVAYVRNRSPPLRKRECDGRSRHLLINLGDFEGAWMYELQCKLPSTTCPGQLRLLGALCTNWVQAKPHAPKMLQIWCTESTTYPDRLRILGASCANWAQMPSTISSTPAKNFSRLERKLGASSLTISSTPAKNFGRLVRKFGANIFDYQFYTG